MGLGMNPAPKLIEIFFYLYKLQSVVVNLHQDLELLYENVVTISI